ncbi:MAG: GAK system XXXCH domain-containing protein [Desulfonatronovibrio sp.]
MKEDKQKMEHILTDLETADFLRCLASGIENGRLDFNEFQIPWDDVKKIKISFKNQGNQVIVKTRLKSEPSRDVEIDFESFAQDKAVSEKKPNISYKNLKKRMKKRFKGILASLNRNIMPNEEAVKVFARDCELMTGFSGSEYGDKFYPDFLQKVQEMKEASSLGDLDKMEKSVSEINNFTRECHDRYK